LNLFLVDGLEGLVLRLPDAFFYLGDELLVSSIRVIYLLTGRYVLQLKVDKCPNKLPDCCVLYLII